MNAKKLLVAALSASMILGAAPVLAEEGIMPVKEETKDTNYKVAYLQQIVETKKALVKEAEEAVKAAEANLSKDPNVLVAKAKLDKEKANLEKAQKEYDQAMKDTDQKIKDLIDQMLGNGKLDYGNPEHVKAYQDLLTSKANVAGKEAELNIAKAEEEKAKSEMNSSSKLEELKKQKEAAVKKAEETKTNSLKEVEQKVTEFKTNLEKKAEDEYNTAIEEALSAKDKAYGEAQNYNPEDKQVALNAADAAYNASVKKAEDAKTTAMNEVPTKVSEEKNRLEKEINDTYDTAVKEAEKILTSLNSAYTKAIEKRIKAEADLKVAQVELETAEKNFDKVIGNGKNNAEEIFQSNHNWDTYFKHVYKLEEAKTAVLKEQAAYDAVVASSSYGKEITSAKQALEKAKAELAEAEKALLEAQSGKEENKKDEIVVDNNNSNKKPVPNTADGNH